MILCYPTQTKETPTWQQPLVSLSFPHQSTHFTMPTCKNVNLHPSTILARCNLLKLLERRVQEEIIMEGFGTETLGEQRLLQPQVPKART